MATPAEAGDAAHAATAEPMDVDAPPTPTRLVRGMDHDVLKSYMTRDAAKPAMRALASLLREHIDSDMALGMADDGINLLRAFDHAGGPEPAGLVGFELELKQVLKVEAAADEIASAAGNRAAGKAARKQREAAAAAASAAAPAAKRPKPPVVGEPPRPIPVRSYAEIQALSKANAVAAKDEAAKGATKQRTKLESDGCTITYTTTAQAKLGQTGTEVYEHLVGCGTEHFNAVLKEMGCTGTYEPADDDDKQGSVTINFSGAALKTFFAAKPAAAVAPKFNADKPVAQVDFFGKHFVSKSFHDSDKKEKALVKDLAKDLTSLKAVEVGKIGGAYDARITAFINTLGKHEAALRRLRREATDAAKAEALLVEREKVRTHTWRLEPAPRSLSLQPLACPIAHD